MIERSAIFYRQSDVLPEELTRDLPITIIGCGAGGSIIAPVLAKMGFNNFRLWDDDIVEAVNLAYTYYRLEDLGKPKVIALKEILNSFGADKVEAINRRFEDDEATEIVLMCADNMDTRANVFHHLREVGGWKHYIECRMSLQEYRVYYIPFGNVAVYARYVKEALYTQAEAVQQRCTSKSIIYSPMGQAEKVGRLMFSILRGEQINFWGITVDLTSACEEKIKIYYDRTKSMKALIEEPLEKVEENEAQNQEEE